jgi:hypothetical protein
MGPYKRPNSSALPNTAVNVDVFSFKMNFYQAIAAFIALSSINASAHADINHKLDDVKEGQQQLLRKAVADMPASLLTSTSSSDDHARKLQIFQNLFQPCNLIENQFPAGQVSCECDVTLLQGTVDFSCGWTSEICVGGANGLCGTPIYSGTLDVFQTTIQNQICINGLSAIGSLLSIGDLCIDLTVNPRNDKILTCSATLGDIACSSCRSCSGGGLSLDCDNASDGAVDSCTANAGSTAAVRTISRVQSSKNRIKQAYFPNFNL